MRRLKTTDVLAAVRVVKAANIREEMKRIALAASQEKASIRDIGVDMLMSVAEGLANVGAEKLLYELVADIFEMKVEELKDGDLIDILDMCVAYKDVEDKERWQAFFDVLAKLLK